MSQNPNQSTSHARSPSVESTTSNQHQRRVSTHSLGISYAYGAPSPQQAPSPRSRRTQNRKPSEEPIVRRQRELSAEETGRAIEPAAVRYQRLQAQRKQTPEPTSASGGTSNSTLNKMASLNNTSVNIATAFKAATSGNGPAMVKGGRREDYPPLEERRGNGQVEEGRDGEGSSKQTVSGGPVVDGSASKKRKVGSGCFLFAQVGNLLTFPLFSNYLNRRTESRILRSDRINVREKLKVVRSIRRNTRVPMGRKERNVRKSHPKMNKV